MNHVAIDQDAVGIVTIPQTVTYGGQELTVVGIEFRAFHNCTKITEVNLPSTITSIGEGAFARCEELASINIPTAVTSIGVGAFEFDSKLTTITLNSGLQSIGNSAFSQTGLMTVNIPASVISIGKGAFGSSTLESITATGNTVYTVYNNATLYDQTHKLVQATKNTVEIPSYITSIGEYAFSYIPITSITIPYTVTSIDKNAFNQSTALSKVVIYAPSLTKYGVDAFNNNASGRKIYVLADKVETYQAGWSTYSSDIMPITLTANDPGTGEYWGSYYNPNTNVTVPEGVIIYKAKVNDASVTLTVIGDNIIKAGQAVVLKKSTSGGIELTSAASAGSGDYTGNELKGGSTVTSGNVPYTLSKTNNGFGFHKFTGTLDPYKAHLELPATTRSFLNFEEEGGTTKINTTIAEKTNDRWYDLNGQKLQGKPTKKGIYMKNGNKYILK